MFNMSLNHDEELVQLTAEGKRVPDKYLQYAGDAKSGLQQSAPSKTCNLM